MCGSVHALATSLSTGSAVLLHMKHRACGRYCFVSVAWQILLTDIRTVVRFGQCS